MVLFLFCVIIIFMRIDRLLCELNIGSRSQVKEYLKKGLIFVNGMPITRPDVKVDETSVVITYSGREYRYQPFVYYMMNKPAGIVSATCDAREKTVLDIFHEKIEANTFEQGMPTGKLQDIFPVGRLDKDTVGLLLLTNDGDLAHRLLSPKKHVPKTYYVRLNAPLTREQADTLEKGVDIGEKTLTKEAVVTIIDEKSCHITITEGKFHQVKRMFQTIGLEVIYLKRLSMGALWLDENLKEGDIRVLSDKEVAKLC